MGCSLEVGAGAGPKFTGSSSSQKGPAPAPVHWGEQNIEIISSHLFIGMDPDTP